MESSSSIGLSSFVRSMGWKEVSLVLKSCSSWKGRHTAISFFRKDLSGLAVTCSDLEKAASGKMLEDGATRGTLAVVRGDLPNFVNILDKVKPHSLVLIMDKMRLTSGELSILEKANVTSAFYMLELQEGLTHYWLVHTFKDQSKVAKMPVSLSSSYSTKRDDVVLVPKISYDLHGAVLRCNALTYSPYFAVENCDTELKNCQVSGPYADMWKEMERKYNFTTQVCSTVHRL